MRPVGHLSRSIRNSLLVFFLGFVAVSLISCGEREGSDEGKKRDEYSSNGERIYFTATSNNGTPIRATGMMHEMTYACSDCHGPDGKGRTVNTMMGQVVTPDIRYITLTAAGHQHDEGVREHGHGDEHPSYTEKTIKRAISDGLDPAGEELNHMMPRWKMSDEDLDDLIEYLKTLK